MSSQPQPQVDPSHYSAILLGTGLTNTIVASGLSKSNHSVLHIDAASEYGSHYNTLNYSSFRSFLNDVNSKAKDESRVLTEEELKRFREAVKDEKGEYEYEPVTTKSSYFNATFVDYTEETKKKQDEAAAAAQVVATEAAANPTVATENMATSEASIAEATAATPTVTTIPLLSSDSRRYAIDLTPQLIFSRSQVIDLLVHAGIHNYLEFKAVDQAYFAPAASSSSSSSSASSASAPSFHQLPLSKSAIFQTTTLSMLDKRLLMKFMHLILGDDYHQSPAKTEEEQKQHLPAVMKEGVSFLQFLKEQKLSQTLIQMIVYAIALLDESIEDASSISATVGVARLRTYLSSIGRYGPGSFLYSSYGVSELSQAFTRLCAVSGGTYMLRMMPEAIVYEKSKGDGEERKYKGVIIPDGKRFITSDVLVAENDYQLSASAAVSAPVEQSGSVVSRCVLFLDDPLTITSSGNDQLTQMSNSAFFSIAPSSPAEAPIYGLQLGFDTANAPKGRTVVHLWITSDSAKAEASMERLRTLAQAITRPIDSELKGKPRLLAIATFQRQVPITEPVFSKIGEISVDPTATTTAPSDATVAPVAEEAATKSDEGATKSDAPSAESTDLSQANVKPPPLPLPYAIVTTPPPSSSLGFSLDTCLKQAETIFHRLCPSMEFAKIIQHEGEKEEHDQDLELLKEIPLGEETKAAAVEEETTAEEAEKQIETQEATKEESTEVFDGAAASAATASATSTAAVPQ